VSETKSAYGLLERVELAQTKTQISDLPAVENERQWKMEPDRMLKQENQPGKIGRMHERKPVTEHKIEARQKSSALAGTLNRRNQWEETKNSQIWRLKTRRDISCKIDFSIEEQ
jgi:hypothetical protein